MNDETMDAQQDQTKLVWRINSVVLKHNAVLFNYIIAVRLLITLEADCV